MSVKIIKKHVILLCVLVFITAMPAAWGLLIPITRNIENEWANIIRYTVTVILSLILMRLIWKRNLFSFGCPKFAKNLFTFGLLGLIGAAGAFVFSRDTVDLTPAFGTILSCILVNLAIAVGEEFLFRGVILHAFLHAWSGKPHVVRAAVIASCVIFGLRHLLNLMTTPASVLVTCAQVVFTFMAGTYLCAVFLRTKNIWVCVLIHFLEDFTTSVWAIFSNSAAASASTDIGIGAAAGMIAMQIPYVVFAILMLKDKNWKYNDTPTEAENC